MRSARLLLPPLIGLCLLRAQPAERNPFEAIPEPSRPSPQKFSGPTIQAIEIRGAVRSSPSILRALIGSRVGGSYKGETVLHDSQALYNTGRFSAINWETEPGSAGIIVRFWVVERPLIQSIEYQGDDTVSITEILERFKQREVKLRAETLYNENDLAHATMVVQDLLAERGLRNVTVTPLVNPIWPPPTVKITFRVELKP